MAVVVVVVVVAVRVLATDDTTADTAAGGGWTTVPVTATAEVPGAGVLGDTFMEGGSTTPEGREGGSCDCVPYLMYCSCKKKEKRKHSVKMTDGKIKI